MEWSLEQRELVAKQFNDVAGGWWKWNGRIGPRTPLWPECLTCHRLDTLERGEDTPDCQPEWRCSRCGAVTPQAEIWDYETELLLNIAKIPKCPPLVLSVLERCASMLFLASEGEPPTPDEAGNMARHALRVLDQYGAVMEDWTYRADERESVLPADLGISDTDGMSA